MSVLKRCLPLGILVCALFSTSPRLAGNPDDPNNLGIFLRGDTNNDGTPNISDAVFLLNYLFVGGVSPPCNPVADINADGKRNIADAIFLLRHLFMGESHPPAPFPACGVDPEGKLCPASSCNA